MSDEQATIFHQRSSWKEASTLVRISRPSQIKKKFREIQRALLSMKEGTYGTAFLFKFLLITIYEFADFFLCACIGTLNVLMYVFILILLDFTARTPPPHPTLEK